MGILKLLLQFVIGVHIALGAIYWLYLSWMFGSILMFFCFFLLPISIPIGIYSLYFGPPLWLVELFLHLPYDIIDIA